MISSLILNENQEQTRKLAASCEILTKGDADVVGDFRRNIPDDKYNPSLGQSQVFLKIFNFWERCENLKEMVS